MAVINGTAASETLPGTAAADTITGAGGNDKALMGGGNDVFVWNPGDGSDVVDGGPGTDTLRFNGANVGESFNIVDVGGGEVRLDRNIDNTVTFLNNVERLELQTLGGNDLVLIDNLGATDLKLLAIDLSNGTPGVGDGAADTIVAEASSANNSITLKQTGSVISATGLPLQITLAAAEIGDFFQIDGNDGNDKISAAGLPAAIRLGLDGGYGQRRRHRWRGQRHPERRRRQ